MEDENEYIGLPDDAEQGFAVLHRRRIKDVEAALNENESNISDLAMRRYIDSMNAFDEVHDLGLLISFRNPPTSDNRIWDFFQDFRRHCEIASQKILMEAARRQKIGAEQIIVLDAATRRGIHALIEALRERLNELKLPEGKRESLFGKLNAFAAEVDRNRTRTEAFYAFAVETARTAKTINDDIKPFQQTIDRIFDWIDKAKQLKDALPPWGERKKIEGPPKQIEPPKSLADTLDDDIPF